MKTIGRRLARPLSATPTGENLLATARLSETISRLASGASRMPKGIFRYKNHEEANRHQEECLVRSMAELARLRNQGQD